MVLGVMTHTVQMAAMRETEETTSMHSSQFVSVVTATYGSSQLSDAVAKDWIVSTSTFVAEAAQHRHAPHNSWATGRRLPCTLGLTVDVAGLQIGLHQEDEVTQPQPARDGQVRVEIETAEGVVGAYQAPTSGSSRNTQVQSMEVVKYVDTWRPFSAPAACGTIE